MKPSISSSGASVSGSVGGQKGSVGIGSNGTVNLGLDFGGAKLGVTNDYGGAGTVGFGGQSITWGAEGGNIKLGIGGFEVIVEARDCVVVETKKIAGMVVSQRSYPDPGCKQPKLPEEKPSDSTPTPTLRPVGLDGTKQVIALVDVSFKSTTTSSTGTTSREAFTTSTWTNSTSGNYLYYTNARSTSVGRSKTQITAWATDTLGAAYIITPCLVNPTPAEVYLELSLLPSNWSGSGWYPVPGGNYVLVVALAGYDSERPPKIIDTPMSGNCGPINYDGGRSSGVQEIAVTVQGRERDVRDWIIAQNDHVYGFGTQTYKRKHTVTDTIPKREPNTPNISSPSAGNRPPMPESCCESLKADIEDIKEVLATKEILAKELQIPGELLEIQTYGMPTPKPEILLNYAQVANATLLAINRYGIDAPIQVQIKDTDTTEKGDQSDEFTYNSPAVAMQAMLELLWEIKGDSASRLKIQVRMAYAITRVLKIVAGVGESVRALIKMLGLPFRYKQKKLALEFNLGAAKKGSGFGKNQGRKGTSSTEAELESLLPGLLKETEYDLPVPEFDAEDDDIRELLVKILMAIQTQKGK